MIRNIVITCKIIQKELGLNDTAYRKILNEVAGVNSSKDLDNEMGLRVIKVLEDMKPKKVEIKKQIIDASKLYRSTLAKKVDPWKYDYNLSEEKWANIGTLIEQYSKQGIILVAVWPAYGEKHIKWRKR